MAKPSDSTKFYVSEKARVEREISDKAYAIKLVERVVFVILSVIGLAVLAAWLKVVNL